MLRRIKAKIKRSILSVAIYILLGAANLMIKFRSFKKLINQLTNSEGSIENVLDEKQSRRVYLIRYIILRTSKYTPWRSKCFEQAIVAVWLMKVLRIPVTIYFGIAKDENKALIAHAWTITENITITGEFTQYIFQPVLIRSKTYYY